MALTASVMSELGRPAPDFRLPDPDGRLVGRDDFGAAKGLLVVFWCNHCPYVKHIKAAFASFAREYQPQGLAIVAINANDAHSHPQDGAARMKEDIAVFGYTFDYLIDETQAVARAYQAACTPDFFLYDGDRRLVYRGQFDSSRPGNGVPITGRDLRAAVGAVLAGTPVPPEQAPSIGCNIKWRRGNAPGDS
jgi:thiol-disulfide isomerase/thioredoxin